jgi:hypothetical protein
MTSEYDLKTTSADSVQVKDIPLSPEQDADTARTRKVARITLVNNKQDASLPVTVTIVHQRRHKANLPWQDVDAFDMRTMKAGEEVRLDLSCAETSALYKALQDSYLMTREGLPVDIPRLRVVDPEAVYIAQGKQRETILRLLEQEGEQFWAAVEDLKPGLIETIARAKTHETRSNAVKDFEQHLAADDWSEGDWEKFFRANKWIFGHSLDYRFLSEIEEQPHYGGTDVSGKGAQRGDFLMASEAATRFTVLVELKKPGSELLGSQTYRNGAYELGKELTGGVSQAQTNCRTWAREGSLQPKNMEMLKARNITTAEPKGFLVIGHTSQLDNTDKKVTFELFRRNLHNPEIITYDELLERARYLVAVPPDSSTDQVSVAEISLVDDVDDIAF